MLKTFALLRNVGTFEAVSAGANLALERMSVIYAENGRGKTTLAAVLRSLAANDPDSILERTRLSGQGAPHVAIKSDQTTHVFQNGKWSSALADIVVFDDQFVSQNVCSGQRIETDHRQNLHELILGEEGVRLNDELLNHVSAIESHNSSLRVKAAAIAERLPRGADIDKFCDLVAEANLKSKIESTLGRLTVAHSAAQIIAYTEFSELHLPRFDLLAIENLLVSTLDNLNHATVERLRTHFNAIGDRGEEWIGEGMEHVQHKRDAEECPFCLQDLKESKVFSQYRTYFGEEYQHLRDRLFDMQSDIEAEHSGDARAGFTRDAAANRERVFFWSDFIAVDVGGLDVGSISARWRPARDAVLEALKKKAAQPLEPLYFDPAARDAIARYHDECQKVDAISAGLVSKNSEIARIKEAAKTDDVSALESDLVRFELMKLRQETEIDLLCQDLKKEKRSKEATEAKREAARKGLDQHRSTVFPRYQIAINDYLRKLNAGFRVTQVKSVNQRTGTTSSYAIEIRGNEIPITNEKGKPAFSNTLSAGDRNALALAFFLASLDQRKDLSKTIVVFDDPITSLDDHRSLATVHEIVDVADRAEQLIVLSHSKYFLGAVWQEVEKDPRTAIRVARDGQGSSLELWNVNKDLVTEHDRRFKLVLEYLDRQDHLKERQVAGALRPMLEAFMRVSYPDHFPPDTLLGPFLGICQQRFAAGDPILSAADMIELGKLKDYGNRWHHDTNPTGYKTDHINDTELVDFCRRTIAFGQRR